MQDSSFLLFWSSFVGVLVFACLTNILPASILGVLGGALFGVMVGFALSSAAFLSAGIIWFIIGRYFFEQLAVVLFPPDIGTWYNMAGSTPSYFACHHWLRLDLQAMVPD
jgi:uncharacterized membrane protein YdjX (TVP38/TMEM64 family)